MAPDDPRHGTYAGYMAGCKTRHQCTLLRPRTCVDAERRYQNRYNRDRAYGRPRKVPSIGSVRRIQALMRLGWPGFYLTERLGMARSNLPSHTKFPTIRSARAEQIKALYDELLSTEVEGPSERTRRRAEADGFLPPEAWDGTYMDDPDACPDYGHQWRETEPEPDIDEIAIERALRGEHVTLTRQERLEAVRRLRQAGRTKTEITKRLRMNGAEINRIISKADAA